MNIQNNYNYNYSYNYNYNHNHNCNYNVSMQAKPKKPGDKTLDKFIKKIEQIILNLLPKKTFSESAKKLDGYEKYGGFVARPDVNRAIMGVTALATQPAIDYYNHRVDEETREVSRNRTIAKIIACTSVGVLVRGACYKLVDAMTRPDGMKKWNKKLLPSVNFDLKKLGTHKSVISTFTALAVMTFTNFLLDAPLTVYFTNKLNARTAKKKKEAEVKNG